MLGAQSLVFFHFPPGPNSSDIWSLLKQNKNYAQYVIFWEKTTRSQLVPNFASLFYDLTTTATMVGGTQLFEGAHLRIFLQCAPSKH